MELGNSDEFLIFHNDPVSKAKSGFRGVFICLGQVRSLIVGMRGRFIVTAHPSRVLLHQRGPHELALNIKEDGVLPPRRTLEWEEPLLTSDIEEFTKFLDSEEDHDSDDGNQMQLIDDAPESGLPEVRAEKVVDLQLDEAFDIPTEPIEVGDISPLLSDPEAKEDALPEVEDIVVPNIEDQQGDDVFADLGNLTVPTKDQTSPGEIEEYQLPSSYDELREIILPIPETGNSGNDINEQSLIDLDGDNAPEGDSFPFSRVAENELDDIVLPEQSSEEAAALSLLEQITTPAEYPEEGDMTSSIILPEIAEDDQPATNVPLNKSGLTEIDELLLTELDNIAEESEARVDLSPEESRKRLRSDDDPNEGPDARKQRLHRLSCPTLGDVELENRLRQAKKEYRNKPPRCNAVPSPGIPQGQAVEIAEAIEDDQSSEVVYCPSQAGMGFRRVYLCDNSRKRTVVHDYEDAVKLPGMKEAMELEINTFKKFGEMKNVF